MRSWELPVSEKAQHLVAEDELGRMGIDVGDGMASVRRCACVD